jgi:hypothetical protein
VRALEDRADRDGELLLAALALVEAGALSFALRTALAAQRVGTSYQAAVRADRAFRPEYALKPIAGCVGIVEDRIVGEGKWPPKSRPNNNLISKGFKVYNCLKLPEAGNM